MVDPFDSFRSPRAAACPPGLLATSASTPRRLSATPSACRHGADAGEACAAHRASRPPRQPPRFRSSKDSRRTNAGSRPDSPPPLPSLRGRCSRNRAPRDPSSSSCSKVKSRWSRAERWLPPDGPGSPLGETALLESGPRTATLLAKTPVSTLVSDKREFDQLLFEVPKVSERLRAISAERRAA